MVEVKDKISAHPSEEELADYLAGNLSARAKDRVEAHIAQCGECLARIVSAHESVNMSRKDAKPRKGNIMNKINPYLCLAILAFALSFVMPRYFIQLLVVTAILGIKWVVDSKTTKMLVMIYEAWKRGGEKEASQIFETFDSKSKSRF